jgi:predicted nucleic acid-binding protein/transposase
MITRGNSFKLLLYYIFLEDTKYMTILTRQERERLVIELYNQGKTYREISKAARISPRDIGVILNRVIQEKTEALKEEGIEQQDDNVKQNKQQEQQQHLSLSAQAYKLFSDRKTPLEVAIALNLRESEATKFYKEYWKLKQLHNLNMVYEETKGNIEPFLRLYKLSKRKGMGVKQVVDALAIANNDLPALERRFKTLRNDVSTLQFRKQILERSLYQLNNQIASTTNLLNSLSVSCGKERREIENLYNEKTRLDALVTHFKNDNEENLNKIKHAANEEVKSVLTNNKLLLKFATLSIIESLRSSSELYNFVLYSTAVETTSATAYGSNYLSLMSEQQQHQQQSFNDSYTTLIVEEAEKLYNMLMTEFTNRVIATAAAMRASLLASPADNNDQKLTYKIDNTYQTEESKYNNPSSL